MNEYAFRYDHRDDSTPMLGVLGARVSKTRHGRYGAYAPLPSLSRSAYPMARHRAGAPATADAVRGLLALPKVISTSPAWTTNTNGLWVRASWPVRHELAGEEVVFNAAASRTTNKGSFVLLWNSVCVARICYGTQHENKHRDDLLTPANTPHLHVWTDACRDGWSEPMTTFLTDDLRSSTACACDVFGIEYSGTWRDPPTAVQKGMYEP